MAKKKISKESLILASTLTKIAPRIGASVITEPGWHIAGQITFKNGTKSYFRYNTLDLNPVGASDIAKDKDYANFFMFRVVKRFFQIAGQKQSVLKNAQLILPTHMQRKLTSLWW